MDVWVVSNPGSSAVGCPHPRPNPGEGRVDLQLNGFEFVVWSQEEYDGWQLSAALKDLHKRGLVSMEKCALEDVPAQKPTMPNDLRPDPFDHEVAYQIAFSPVEMDDLQLRRINLFKSDEPNRVWHPEADLTYLKTRHYKMLNAAKWYLEVFVTKRTESQNRRLRDIKRQLKAIDGMG